MHSYIIYVHAYRLFRKYSTITESDGKCLYSQSVFNVFTVMIDVQMQTRYSVSN
jgi:hypothetical protein